MLLRSVLTLSLGAASLAASAQRKWIRDYKEPEFSEPIGWSLGMTTGLSDLWGDVGTKSPIDHYGNGEYWNEPHFMGSIYLRYTLHPAFAMRLSAGFGTLYARDSWNKDAAEGAESLEDDAVQRYLRNQDVRNRVWEGSLMAELMPRRFNATTSGARRRFQPYLMAGIGVINHRPQTTWTSRPTNGGGHGQWVDIWDLNLEGQGWNFPNAPAKEDRWQIAVPLGIGARWDLGEQIGLGVEYLFRFTTTDYLDGVSAKYIPTSYYEAQLPEDKVQMARDISDKTWQILGKEYSHAAGERRGDRNSNDAFSTLSVNFFWKLNSRKRPWWN
jgi:opacity protein-like surface antigen